MSLSTVPVVLGALAGVTACGVERRARTVAGFFLAGRAAPFRAVAAGIVALGTGVLTFPSPPGFAGGGDFGFRWSGLGFAPGRTAGSPLLLPSCRR